MPKRDFERLLLEAIDGALCTLGESPKQAIYFHLDKSFNIKKQEIPNNLKGFEEAIQKTFGPGAEFLEILIMKQISDRLGRPFKRDRSEKITLARYVTVAKQDLEVEIHSMTSREDCNENRTR